MQPQRNACTRQQAADKCPPPWLPPSSLVQEAPSRSEVDHQVPGLDTKDPSSDWHRAFHHSVR